MPIPANTHFAPLHRAVDIIVVVLHILAVEIEVVDITRRIGRVEQARMLPDHFARLELIELVNQELALVAVLPNQALAFLKRRRRGLDNGRHRLPHAFVIEERDFHFGRKLLKSPAGRV